MPGAPAWRPGRRAGAAHQDAVHRRVPVELRYDVPGHVERCCAVAEAGEGNVAYVRRRTDQCAAGVEGERTGCVGRGHRILNQASGCGDVGAGDRELAGGRSCDGCSGNASGLQRVGERRRIAVQGHSGSDCGGDGGCRGARRGQSADGEVGTGIDRGNLACRVSEVVADGGCRQILTGDAGGLERGSRADDRQFAAGGRDRNTVGAGVDA